jgi:SAM-dependent methyltransferase
VGPSPTISCASLYDALAPVYDEWQAWNGMTPFARVAAAKLEPVLRREARRGARARAQPFAHLDLGCGTGTMLVALHDAEPGWRLTGMDGSAGMLAVARAKPGAGDIGWTRGALAAPLPFARAFDSCSILYDTINHLPDPAAVGRAFGSAAAVLRPGGLLIFDVTNRFGFERWWTWRVRFGGEGWTMSIEADFDPDTDTAIANVSITRPGCDGLFQLRERCYEGDELRAALAAAGFEVEWARRWAPFPKREPGKTLWVARLPRST